MANDFLKDEDLRYGLVFLSIEDVGRLRIGCTLQDSRDFHNSLTSRWVGLLHFDLRPEKPSRACQLWGLRYTTSLPFVKYIGIHGICNFLLEHRFHPPFGTTYYRVISNSIRVL